jgi:hypothetical protein
LLMFVKIIFQPYCLPDSAPFQKSIIFLHIFALLVSRDTFVATKIVLKVGFLERDHLAEKNYWTKMGQKIHCEMAGDSVPH